MKLKTLYCCVLFLLLAPILGLSDKGPTFTNDPCQQGGKKSDPPAGCGCPTITLRTVKINLTFDASNDPYRTCTFPDYPSDPAIFFGSATPGVSSAYYCVITIAPSIPTNCLSGVTTTFHMVSPWGSSQRAVDIQAPSGVVCGYTVEFYEACNSCHNGASGRPYYTYSGTFGNTDTFTNAYLLYSYTSSC